MDGARPCLATQKLNSCLKLWTEEEKRRKPTKDELHLAALTLTVQNFPVQYTSKNSEHLSHIWRMVSLSLEQQWAKNMGGSKC